MTFQYIVNHFFFIYLLEDDNVGKTYLIAWKIVRAYRYKCRIFYHPLSFVPKHMGIQYRLNHTLKRRDNCGPYACFMSLETALMFLRAIGKRYQKSIVIMKCLIVISEDKGLWIKNDTTFRGRKQRRTTYRKLPQGTILADEVLPFQIEAI